MIEKDVKEKEVQNEKEIDTRLKELIEIMKFIQKEMPNADPSERITIFLRYVEELKHNNFGTEKQNMNTSPVNLESLLNSLTFRTAKNGDLKYAVINMDLADKLPKKFVVNGKEYSVKTYENENKAVIYENIKKDQKQKNVQKNAQKQ